ncbi:MAG TPA: hypothetical protein VGK93_01815 [Candidatus Eisenbacteria bacterium]
MSVERGGGKAGELARLDALADRDLKPKATCPHCARPVALANRSHCLYCGKGIAIPASVSERRDLEAAWAVANVMLEPGSVGARSGTRRMLRMLALGVGAVLMLGVVGTCGRLL